MLVRAGFTDIYFWKISAMSVGVVKEDNISLACSSARVLEDLMMHCVALLTAWSSPVLRMLANWRRYMVSRVTATSSSSPTSSVSRLDWNCRGMWRWLGITPR